MLVQVDWAHCAVVLGRVVLGVVVSEIIRSGLPENLELVLADAISHPVEAHIHGFGSFLFDCVIDDAVGTRVVGLNGCGRLIVA